MTEPIQGVKVVSEDIILKLDTERRREIDQVRKDVENLMREDMKLDHKADLMLNEQRLLKERIEEGISKTVWATSKKVDDILIAFGELKKEKESQDLIVKNVQDNFKTIQDDFKIIYRSVYLVCFVAIVISVVKYFFK